MLLGGLPGCTAVGELRHIWERGVLGNRLCGCGEPFHECPFWSAVGREAFGGWDAAGAKLFGYPTVWVNRLNQPREELGVEPDQTVPDLNGLLAFVLKQGR